MNAITNATEWVATRGMLLALAALVLSTLTQCGGR